MTDVPDIDGLIASLAPSAGSPVFRALTVEGRRRALRLEADYWDAVEAIAREEKTSLGDLLAAIDRSALHTNNLASAVRQFVLLWTRDRLATARNLASVRGIESLVAACPSPAFALSSKRQLRAHNPAFLRYLRRNIQMENTGAIGGDLRLQLDMGMDELFREFAKRRSSFVTVGFAIGISQRRVRGRMHAIQAPCWDDEMIIGYIVT